MEYYARADLTEIVERTADILRWKSLMRQLLSWPYAVVELLVSPIVSLKRVRDFAQIMGNGVIDDVITDKALTMLDVDHEGLDYVDQKSFVP